MGRCNGNYYKGLYSVQGLGMGKYNGNYYEGLYRGYYKDPFLHS